MAREYTECLLNNGSESTDGFIKAMGKEFSEKLYQEILFKTN